MISSRIGVCSWSLRPTGPGDLADTVKRLDLSAVQLALNPAVQEPSVWGRTVESLAGAGVRVVSGMMTMSGEDYSTLESIRHTGGVRLDTTWADNRECASRVARLAQVMGIGLVTFHAGFLEGRDDRTRHVMIDRVATIADLFAAQGIEVALETGQERAGTLVGVLEELQRANVAVNFDPANMILYGTGDPVVALRQAAPFVRQVHVKDAVPTEVAGTWGTEVAVGQGAVDWNGFFEVAASLEPPVNFIIEREAGENRDRDIAEARSLVERYLEK